jgi:nucleoside-diphosphate-sugar epimerase
LRILVTGAAGFICSAVLRVLAARGHETIAVIRGGVAPVSAAKTIHWDLERKRPEILPRNIDAVIHGAQSRHHRSLAPDADGMFSVNVAGTWSVLNYAATSGARRFCLLSSGTVYEPYRGLLDEGAPMAPTSFLGATKLAAEALARPYGSTLELCVLRLFSPYGPGQRDRLVPEIVERVRTGKAVELAADGDGLWLTPTHVDDVARIIAAAVEDGWTGTTNVAAPEAVSLRQLAETVGDLLACQPVFKTTDREPIRLVPTLGRLAERFDLKQFIPLRDGLRRVIEMDAIRGSMV